MGGFSHIQLPVRLKCNANACYAHLEAKIEVYQVLSFPFSAHARYHRDEDARL